MKKYILVGMLLITVGSLNLQCGSKKATTAGAPNIGSLLSQFAGGLNPASFVEGWGAAKGGWMNGLSSLTNAPGIASSISSLAGFIKPDMFKTGLSPQTIMDGAKSVSDMAGATGLLKNLEGGLKPEAFTADWAGKKSGWMNALGMLK